MWPFNKKKKKEFSTYPGFPYHAGELSAYLAELHYFIIALKNGEVIHHHPENSLTFHDWLIANKIRDINKISPVFPYVPKGSRKC
ncbi:MAG: hypothetical protein P4L41_10760 [Flavipsychrobacter sp.]|nr:hypothetical protein [Flavipsychrobacter sp.]